VTFQDHPYQPAFLDTWTLLSYVAARTSRVRLAPNVVNLPLRPPAVLARSAASLDLLSGGRFELGLGAGAFWDAIEAFGGRRLTPAQAVDALREAIAVIRAVWGTGPRRVEGTYYSLRGAKIGPAPAHDVGIWVGAYKPRMLELTGAVADGWLPSIGRMTPAELRDANARIDEAANENGRDPAQVRRLANIMGEIGPDTVDQWVDRLTALALDLGFSTFICVGDDPSGYRIVAEQIAPRVRAQVAQARA
jgi:alkanesulfonate monooxygenase SsuD/methylene tetrahydromethanopterin reductase-like flavin-dependent oxidoreductase (luciferase family)